jgi:hypothetical protein
MTYGIHTIKEKKFEHKELHKYFVKSSEISNTGMNIIRTIVEAHSLSEVMSKATREACIRFDNRNPTTTIENLMKLHHIDIGLATEMKLHIMDKLIHIEAYNMSTIIQHQVNELDKEDRLFILRKVSTGGQHEDNNN